MELIRKVCREPQVNKSQYVKCVFALVNGASPAVIYEAANSLVALSSAPTAVRAAVSAYCSLLAKESDNNIKLVILGRLEALKRRNEKILQEMLMDIMRTLSCPNLDIRRKVLDLAIELLGPRNVEDVVSLLKKEMQKTDSPDSDVSGAAYRKLLVESLHKCAVRFPDVVGSVVELLLNYIGDDNARSLLRKNKLVDLFILLFFF